MIIWIVEPIIGNRNSHVRTSIARSAENCLASYYYKGNQEYLQRDKRHPIQFTLERAP